MESDSLFCQLFKQLPGTLFELLDLPPTRAKAYRFDSVELKKSLRIDGLFVPKRPPLPLYFVEVQFQHVQKFYANLFAKVFCYFEENDPRQEWMAVAIFPSRREEPTVVEPYADLLRSKRVRRVYLDESTSAQDAPLGPSILKLLFASELQSQELAPRLIQKAEAQLSDSELSSKVVQLVEELLMSRFPQYGLQEVRMKFKLHDLRESKVWKEAQEEKQIELRKAVVEKLMAKGMSHKEIAEVLGVSITEVRRLALVASK